MACVTSYIFCSVGMMIVPLVLLRMLSRHLDCHLRRHHVTRKAAQRQQGDHEGEEKNTHR